MSPHFKKINSYYYSMTFSAAGQETFEEETRKKFYDYFTNQ